VGNQSEITPALTALDMGTVHPIDITIKQPQRPAGAPGEGAQ
jgi:hypothetical protein